MESVLQEYERKGEPYREKLARRHTATSQDAKEAHAIHGTWQFENLMLSLIRDGEVEQLRSFMEQTAQNADFNTGTLAKDPLRQAKNLMIGLTAMVGKVAGIGGGMDIEDAYRLIDLYTQECENAGSVEAVNLLQFNMVMDFTERVRLAKLPENLSHEVFEAVQFIGNRTHEVIGIDDVAAHVGRSRSYITRRFRSEMGSSINEFIIEEKLRDAKRYLRYTDMPLGKIAGALAFSSQAYFQTVFKRETGVTPGEYRNRHARGA